MNLIVDEYDQLGIFVRHNDGTEVADTDHDCATDDREFARCLTTTGGEARYHARLAS